MALRHIQVGDNLSGQTVYFTLDPSDQSSIDEFPLHVFDSAAIETENGYFHLNSEMFSMGERTFVGWYTGEREWGPDITFAQIAWYNGSDHADLENIYNSYVMPSNAGEVSYIDTDAYIYNFFYIEDGLSAKIYYQNNKIKNIYKGTTKIKSVAKGSQIL